MQQRVQSTILKRMQHAITSAEHDIAHDREEIDGEKKKTCHPDCREREKKKLGLMHLVSYLFTPSQREDLFVKNARANRTNARNKNKTKTMPVDQTLKTRVLFSRNVFPG